MNLDHLPCPCGKSSDAFSVQENGWGKCFSGSCSERGPKHNFPPGSFTIEGVPLPEVPPLENGDYAETPDEKKTKSSDREPTSITGVFRAYEKRGLTKETIKHYRVDVGGPNSRYEAKYPIFTIDGRHFSNKVRFPDKKFIFEGTPKDAGVFGRHCFAPGSARAITVTEGQDDAMAVFQMMGSKYPAVSVHSSSTAKQDCINDFEYLNSFDSIYLAFDADEAGEKATRQVCEIGFPVGKIKVLRLNKYKDANEYLLNGDSQTFNREWWNAGVYRPDGLRLGAELLDDILSVDSTFTVPYPYEPLNKMTYGLRLSEAVLLMADTGVGKTSVLKEIEYSILRNPEVQEKGYGVGFLHLEEPNKDTALGLLSIHREKPYHLPDTPKTVEELTEAHGEVFKGNNAVLYDHFGSNAIDDILDKIRHMVAMGCKYIFVDHLSIIVSDQSGDERKQLDEISTKLKTLTMELEIAVFCVIHTNREGQARGSAGPEKVANIHMSLFRNKEDPDEWRRNILKIVIHKNRFCGKTGPCLWLEYFPDTGRLIELPPEQIGIYEQGGSCRNKEEKWA